MFNNDVVILHTDSTVYLALEINNKQLNPRIFTNGPRNRDDTFPTRRMYTTPLVCQLTILPMCHKRTAAMSSVITNPHEELWKRHRSRLYCTSVCVPSAWLIRLCWETPSLVHSSAITRSDLLSALMKDAAVHIYIKTFPKHSKLTLCGANEYTATRNTCLSAGMWLSVDSIRNRLEDSERIRIESLTTNTTPRRPLLILTTATVVMVTKEVVVSASAVTFILRFMSPPNCSLKLSTRKLLSVQSKFVLPKSLCIFCCTISRNSIVRFVKSRSISWLGLLQRACLKRHWMKNSLGGRWEDDRENAG